MRLSYISITSRRAYRTRYTASVTFLGLSITLRADMIEALSVNGLRNDFVTIPVADGIVRVLTRAEHDTSLSPPLETVADWIDLDLVVLEQLTSLAPALSTVAPYMVLVRVSRVHTMDLSVCTVTLLITRVLATLVALTFLSAETSASYSDLVLVRLSADTVLFAVTVAS